jgi:hypothetical protein
MERIKKITDDKIIIHKVELKNKLKEYKENKDQKNENELKEVYKYNLNLLIQNKIIEDIKGFVSQKDLMYIVHKLCEFQKLKITKEQYDLIIQSYKIAKHTCKKYNCNKYIDKYVCNYKIKFDNRGISLGSSDILTSYITIDIILRNAPLIIEGGKTILNILGKLL